jgi:bisphosphoglycerate-dependent phosphoglycerate mutase
MRKLLLFYLLIPTIILGQTRDKKVNERINYFKSNPIFVTQLTLDEKVIKKLSDREIEEAKLETEKINKNIRTAFTTFWDINDTMIFVLDKELKTKKKEFKGSIFFEIIKLGEYTNDRGQVIPVTAFWLSRPNKTDYFKNVVPRPGGVDSSLVNIVTELRQLKLNVMTGDIWNKKDLGIKIILINKDDQRNKLGENYIGLIRSKYKDSIMEVDNKFVLEALMRKDSKYIYIKNGATFNVEDGTMIPLN